MALTTWLSTPRNPCGVRAQQGSLEIGGSAPVHTLCSFLCDCLRAATEVPTAKWSELRYGLRGQLEDHEWRSDTSLKRSSPSYGRSRL